MRGVLRSNYPPERIPDDARLELRQRLERDYKDMAARCLDLEVGIRNLPTEITSEEEAKRVTDFLGKQVGELIKDIEAAHKREKATVLALSREHDSFFLAMSKRLRSAIAPAQAAIARFAELRRQMIRQAEEHRRRAAEEERRRAEAEAEAHRKAAEEAAAADRAAAREHLRQAQEAQAEAAAAQKVIEAPPDDVNIRGDHGSTGYLRDGWDFRIDDPFEVPMRYTMINEALIRADIAEADRRAKLKGETRPGIEIPGIVIFPKNIYVAKG